MKKGILALMLTALLALPSLASAQVREGSVHLSPMVGYTFMDSGLNIDDGLTYSMGLGYNFTKNWGLELNGTLVPSLDFDRDARPGNADVSMASLNALYHFGADDSPFVPYITAGGGGFWRRAPKVGGWNNYNSGMFQGGLGFKYFFTEDVAMRVQAQDVYAFGGDGYNNIVLTAGLTFQLGPQTAACADSDGDGVCDEYDKCPGTPAGYKVDASGCPITVTIQMDVKFDFDKSEVKPEYYPEVTKVADFMKERPGVTAVVEGHTDSKGTPEYNQKLSERRANAVRDSLVNNFGIAADRLTAVGYGLTKPIATNETAAGRAQNRRVVGVLSGSDIDE